MNTFDVFGDGVKKQRVGRLKTPADVAAYIARCVRASEQEGGDVAKEKMRVDMAMKLLRAIQAAHTRRKSNTLNLDLPQIDGID